MRSARRRVITRLVVVGTLVVAVVLVIGSVLFVQRLKELGLLQKPAPPMSEFAPTTVTGIRDVPYGSGPRERLDAWFPKTVKPGETLPTVVWVHGGGWISGDKAYVAPYLQIFADRGFTVVGINYSLAPGDRYPTQVGQLNAALGHLVAHAEELHVDPRRIVLAGDSGGAQISAQVAALTADPSFAAELQIAPALDLGQISGVLIASGIFDLESGVDVGRTVAEYIDSYLGTTTDKALLARASVTNHLTANFPPTWVTGGNVDPLTSQARTFATRLEELGVDVDTEFYDKDHDPPLIHEYQFDLSKDDSQAAIDSAVRFLRRVTR